MATLDEIMQDSNFVEADGELCVECGEPAVGEIEWYNFSDPIAFLPLMYYCEKHLVEKYGDGKHLQETEKWMKLWFKKLI